MPVIKVESTWSGHKDEHGFRLTLPDGSRESVRGSEWNRRTATEALNLFERVYGIPRSTIRFEIR